MVGGSQGKVLPEPWELLHQSGVLLTEALIWCHQCSYCGFVPGLRKGNGARVCCAGLLQSPFALRSCSVPLPSSPSSPSFLIPWSPRASAHLLPEILC